MTSPILVFSIAVFVALGAVTCVPAIYAVRKREPIAAISTLMPLGQLLTGLLIAHYLLARNAPAYELAGEGVLLLLCAIVDLALFKSFLTIEQQKIAACKLQTAKEQVSMQRRRLNDLIGRLDSVESTQVIAAQRLNALHDALECDTSGQGMDGDSLRTRIISITDEVAPAFREYCKHPIVNAVLSAKSQTGTKRGVFLDVQVAVPRDIAITGVDLCAVFSNAIDNALNACSKGDMVYVGAHVRGGFLVVNVKNPCPPSFEDAFASPEHANRAINNAQDTSNAAFRDHGWGLAILEEIGKSYNGTLSTCAQDGTFTTIVTLQA